MHVHQVFIHTFMHKVYEYFVILCVYMCVCVYIYICMYIDICVCVYIYISIRTLVV
jgi:hypothetical protein